VLTAEEEEDFVSLEEKCSKICPYKDSRKVSKICCHKRISIGSKGAIWQPSNKWRQVFKHWRQVFYILHAIRSTINLGYVQIFCEFSLIF